MRYARSIMELEWGGINKVARAVWPVVAALTFAILSTAPVRAQTPTPEQIEIFRNLPPDQQQAVLEAMGGADRGAVRQDQPLATTPEAAARRTQKQTESLGPPRIGSRATLLLEVELQYDFDRRRAAAAAAGGLAGPTSGVPGSASGPTGVSPTTSASPTPPPALEDIVQPDAKTLQLLTNRRDRIRNGNPYQTNNEGQIALPVAPPINLAGLTDAEAAHLLNADPRLTGLHFTVTLLPIQPTGNDALMPFGYNLFEQAPSTFAPVNDIPVPPDYRIGPGDTVTVELFGKRVGRYQLVVDRAGALTLPEFGPIQVAGLTFDQVRTEIERRVAEQATGTRASVAMGQLRSIRVFVVGDVVSPGSYTVSGLSTITNALFVSGGVSPIGSLRNIELKRHGRTVARLDLYDLLLKGDTSQDSQLQQGDAIFVLPIGHTAAIAGQVRRPAIYELRGAASVGDLIELAGGLNAEADPRAVRMERIGENRERTVVDLDLTVAADRSRELLAGDTLTVPKVLDDTNGVTLVGNVQRPGAYAWSQGMRLTDLLGSLQAFKIDADQRYIVIRREHAPDRRVEVLSADATRAFAAKGSDADLLLQSRDRVIVFTTQADRGGVLTDLLQELRAQARDNAPMPVVSISGRVRAPGDYPLESNMTVADLIRAGGGLDDAAYPATVELTRYQVIEGQARKTQVVELDLANLVASGDSSQEASGARTPLRAYDVVVVKETPNWREQESITLRGEVRFPGIYPIRSRETLSSVIARAGGLTEGAFAKGSVFTREEIKDQEREQIGRLANRMQSDLTLLAVQSAQTKNESGAQMLAAGQSLLTQLRSAQPSGRLVIDLKSALAHQHSQEDIELRDGDTLIVPRARQYVTVIGEVQNPTSHVWKSGLTRSNYVRLSGGTTPRADEKRIYVVKANGSVVTASGNSWFDNDAGAVLEPGDTIVVPLDAERMRALPLWTAVTTIIYNLAVAVAAVNSF
jgi:protein involved in polysaccharide export with SLBB domain